MRMWMVVTVVSLVAVLPGPAHGLQDTKPQLAGQEGRSGPGGAAYARAGKDLSAPRVLEAERIGSAIRLDGRLDEAAWNQARVAGSFVQQTPDEGQPASQPTEVRILRDGSYLYVGARLYDSAPDSVIARLARRDEAVFSDWFWVYLDSYHDNRTAFGFGVNAAGVERDQRASEDDRFDASWDAVWDAEVVVDQEGWVAEIRIPLSQLRFNSTEDGGAASWGVNFARNLARANEMSFWAPVPQDANGFVSLFGELEGMGGLEAPRRLEIEPYTVTRMTRAPGSQANPFHDASEVRASVGGDIQMGLGGGLTLSATLNPDFGQVEADPSFINLGAFEVFQQERRPFFVEGADIFRPSGPGGRPNFYSRRIGRRPQGRLPGEAAFSDVPDATTILGAAQLSGKTRDGWSIGLLNAVTGEERADYVTGAGERGQVIVEPRTNYAVARVAREFRDGNSSLGILTTATNRSLDGTGLDFLHSAAYMAGLDGFHRFGGGDYEVGLQLNGSHVRGSPQAIARTQQAAGRYLQRPDADHLDFDPSRTSLSGYQAKLSVAKSRGNWQFMTNTEVMSAGWEVNDLGFSTQADHAFTWGRFGYNDFTPGTVFRDWNLNLAAGRGYTLGGERKAAFHEINGNYTLLNYWGGGFWVQRHLDGTVDPVALRGGPALANDPLWRGGVWLNSDRRKQLRAHAFSFWEVEDDTGDRTLNLNGTVTLRASDRLDVEMGPSINLREDASQYVGTRTVAGEPVYLAGRIDQKTVSLSTRVNYTFSPDLTVQLWARPFVASGRYDRFKEVADPRAGSLDERFHTYSGAEITPVDEEAGSRTFDVDRDADGEADFQLTSPDFNTRSFQLNAVLRWEYRPGSTLFAVWSHDRSDFGRTALDLGRDLSDLWGAAGRNVFALKVSYWLGM